MPTIHVFDDEFAPEKALLKTAHDNIVVYDDVVFAHSTGTIDFKGFDEIPDAIYLDGHMPGSWEPVIDWLYDHIKSIVKPIMIIANSYNAFTCSSINARIDVIRSTMSRLVVRNYDDYLNVGGTALFVRNNTALSCGACDMSTQRFHYAVTQCSHPIDEPIPLADLEFMRCVAECFADSSMHPSAKRLSYSIVGNNLSIKDQFVSAKFSSNLKEQEASVNLGSDFSEMPVHALMAAHGLTYALESLVVLSENCWRSPYEYLDFEVTNFNFMHVFELERKLVKTDSINNLANVINIMYGPLKSASLVKTDVGFKLLVDFTDEHLESKFKRHFSGVNDILCGKAYSSNADLISMMSQFSLNGVTNIVEVLMSDDQTFIESVKLAVVNFDSRGTKL